MIKVLNLYAGIGGNRKNWKNVEITAVEMEPKIAKIYTDNFPNDKMIVGDAHQYLLDHFHEFDFIWTSPPCQTHSKMAKATRHKLKRYSDMTLYQEIIFLQHFFKGHFLVENVKPFYTPLIPPSKTLGRHIVWSNFEIEDFEMPNFKNFIQADSKEQIEALKKWIGIHYEGNVYYKNNHSPGQILRNCVHPKFGEHVFNCFLNSAEKRKTSKIVQEFQFQ